MARHRSKTSPNPPPRTPSDRQWWLFAAAIPLVLCSLKLNLDLWYDEVYTVVAFVARPWPRIVTDYSAPNNHVLYSLLLRPVFLVSDSTFVLRLLSLAVTAGTLAIVFRLGRRLGGTPLAAMSTLALGLTQMFLNHTMQVRGYGLSMLLAAYLGELAVDDAPRFPRRRVAAIVIAGAALVYVLPTNLVFLVPLAMVAAAWRALCGGGLRGTIKESAAWIGACLVGAALYLPVAGQLVEAARRQGPAPPSTALHLAGGFFSAALRDWWPIVPLAAVGIAFWVRETRRQPSRRRWLLPLLTVAMLTIPFVLTAVLRLQPFVRNYCPALPLVALAIAWLVAECVAGLGPIVARAWPPSRTALAGMLLLAAAALPRIATYPARLAEYRSRQFAQDGYYEYYAADYHPGRLADYLRDSIDPALGHRILYPEADHVPLQYHLLRAGVPRSRDAAGGFQGSGTPVYLILPPLVDYEALARETGLSEETLRGFELEGDFGYYRLLRSPKPLPAYRLSEAELDDGAFSACVALGPDTDPFFFPFQQPGAATRAMHSSKQTTRRLMEWLLQHPS